MGCVCANTDEIKQTRNKLKQKLDQLKNITKIDYVKVAAKPRMKNNWF
jgi:hypothetical protein